MKELAPGPALAHVPSVSIPHVRAQSMAVPSRKAGPECVRLQLFCRTDWGGSCQSAFDTFSFASSSIHSFL